MKPIEHVYYQLIDGKLYKARNTRKGLVRTKKAIDGSMEFIDTGGKTQLKNDIIDTVSGKAEAIGE